MQEARPIAISIATVVNWLANFVVGLVFPYLLVSMCNRFVCLFVYLFVWGTWRGYMYTVNSALQVLTKFSNRRSTINYYYACSKYAMWGNYYAWAIENLKISSKLTHMY